MNICASVVVTELFNSGTSRRGEDVRTEGKNRCEMLWLSFCTAGGSSDASAIFVRVGRLLYVCKLKPRFKL